MTTDPERTTTVTDPIALPAEDARGLLDFEPGQEAFDGWTIAADEHLGEGRWTERRRLVIRNGDGQHYAARYERGLTEQQETYPWEGDKPVTFTPVVARTRMVEITEYVREGT